MLPFCMVYASPNTSADYHKELTGYLDTITPLPNPVFILGDFNLIGQLLLAQLQLLMISVSVHSNLTSLNL